MDTESVPPTPKEKEAVEKAEDKMETASSEAASSGTTSSGTTSSGATSSGAAGSETTVSVTTAAPGTATAPGTADKEAGNEKAADEAADQTEKKEPEANFQLLSNPARVLPQQVHVCCQAVCDVSGHP